MYHVYDTADKKKFILNICLSCVFIVDETILIFTLFITQGANQALLLINIYIQSDVPVYDTLCDVSAGCATQTL